MKWATTSLIFLSLCFAGQRLAAGPNLIVNGGFEAGTYSSTIGIYTNPNVPNGWVPNLGFDKEPGFNDVRNDNPLSGTSHLSIGNFDYEPLAQLSQTFADTPGDPYIVHYSFYATSTGDGNAYFQTSVAGVSSPIAFDNILIWTPETYGFIGTGLDTFTISAQTDPGEWYVDDVSISPAVGVAPDAVSSASLLIATLAGLVLLRRRPSVITA